MTHFCQELHKQVTVKFPSYADSVVSEFLFDRWLLKALCDDGNKTGLVTSVFISDNLSRNLQLVRDALSSLIASTAEFNLSVPLLPKKIREVC